jgi:hypothetical protein
LHNYQVAAVAYTDNLGTSGTANINASFGGGKGGLFTYGYEVLDFLELTASLGAQWSGNDNGAAANAANAPSGGFIRGVILIGPQLNVPLYHETSGLGVLRLTLEGGSSFYGGPSLDTNLSGIPGGTDTVLKYASPFGWHGAAGIEYVGGRSGTAKVGLGLCVGYYSVSYTLQSASQNGAATAISNIAQEFQKVSGDSVNVSLYMAVFL